MKINCFLGHLRILYQRADGCYRCRRRPPVNQIYGFLSRCVSQCSTPSALRGSEGIVKTFPSVKKGPDGPMPEVYCHLHLLYRELLVAVFGCYYANCYYFITDFRLTGNVPNSSHDGNVSSEKIALVG